MSTPIPTHELKTFGSRESREDEEPIEEANIGLANAVWQTVNSRDPTAVNSIFGTIPSIVAAANAGSDKFNFTAPASSNNTFRESMHRAFAKNYLPPQLAQKFKGETAWNVLP